MWQHYVIGLAWPASLIFVYFFASNNPWKSVKEKIRAQAIADLKAKETK